MAECIGVSTSDADLPGGKQVRVAPEADAKDAANERHVDTHDASNTQVRDLSGELALRCNELASETDTAARLCERSSGEVGREVSANDLHWGPEVA